MNSEKDNKGGKVKVNKKRLIITSAIALVIMLVLGGVWLENKSAEAKVNERIDAIEKAVDELYEYNELKEDLMVKDIYVIKNLIDKENSKKLTKAQNDRLQLASDRLSVADNGLEERLLLDDQLEFIKSSIANIYKDGILLDTANVETIDHIEKLLIAEENSKLTTSQKALLTTLTSDFNDAKRLFDEKLIALAKKEKMESAKKDKKDKKKKSDENKDKIVSVNNSTNSDTTKPSANNVSGNNNNNSGSNSNKSTTTKTNNTTKSSSNNQNSSNKTNSTTTTNNNSGSNSNKNTSNPPSNNNNNTSGGNNKPAESKPPAKDVDEFGNTLQDWLNEGWVLSIWGSDVTAVNRNPEFWDWADTQGWSGFIGRQSKWGYMVKKRH